MLASKRQRLSGWGRTPVQECRAFRPEKQADLAHIIRAQQHILARGLGRSYGDAALQPEGVILTERLNHFMEFDSKKGMVRAQAGVTLAEIMEQSIPRGWFPPVLPGTRHVTIGGVRYPYRAVGPADGGQLRVTPLRPVPEILAESLQQSPPSEPGQFRPADLVELTKLDPTIHLEIRYATTNNFLGSKFYAEARAFMQRPAAEAVARAAHALEPLGYGLLIHDGYRPWFVTKTFWEATPQEKKWLVADPSKGSKHNRGCAVDLTLYDLKTGRVIEMPSTYDESTLRAFAFYPGGTGLQRWHRALLRRVMEAEGFAVNPEEWWHFDHKDWQQYSIGNVPFDKISPPRS